MREPSSVTQWAISWHRQNSRGMHVLHLGWRRAYRSEGTSVRAGTGIADNDATEQTNCVCLRSRVPYPVLVLAKCTQSPAFVYFIVAMSIVTLYSLITAIAALCFILTEPVSRAGALLIYLVWDVVMLGLVASGAGTAGATAYIGFKGNKHAGWAKVCDVYETFCHRVAASIIISLIAGLVLILLITLSAHSLHHGVPK